ncbi:hypothetical protein NLG97_g1608 [Lecanicillium saksenae]|uniref:Uncharacterized protein n=1 Tax=Lecanicillium saksenae TaxID=468837 RepID=A0ACC1R398_9HYPO|nr:hypothetical protein NLG97_g1608 [Lecanicillium saksenae]
MTLPLHYKANRKRPARICPHTRRRGSAVCGGLLTLALGIICTLLLISLSNEVGADDHLVKRGLQNANIFAQSSSEKEFDITPNSVDSPVDLLGGLTSVMSHFRIESMDKVSSIATKAPQITSAPVFDPLAALSEAFLEAFDVREVLQGDVNSQIESIGQRSYPQTMPYSILWANQPSLLSILSDVVGQVCVIDSGAGARLLDAILEAVHVGNTDFTSIINGVTEISSISTTHILPLILPALATALGIHVQQSPTSHYQPVEDVMAKIISHGGLFITEIMNSEVYLTSTDLYDCMNQLAGLMCAAADHLKLPICSASPPVTSQNLEGYMPPAAGSTTEWNVLPIRSYTM